MREHGSSGDISKLTVKNQCLQTLLIYRQLLLNNVASLHNQIANSHTNA